MHAEQTVRDFWATRPVRPTTGRKISGVAAAIGRRYSIDPVLVRVAFVVATFFSGVGVLLYLLGWLLFPAEGDEVSAAEGLLGRGHSSVSPALTVVLGLALIPVGSMVLDRYAYGILGFAAAAAALFLLHRSRAGLGEIPPARTTKNNTTTSNPTAPNASGASDTSGADAQGASTGPTADPPSPPTWDPLGAAPFAWDLPEPVPASPSSPPSPQPFGSKITPITVGLALLAGGIAVAFALAAGQIVAIALAVVGLGMVVGSLVGGGRGLIAVAVPLALLTWVLQAVPISGVAFGNQQWKPASAGQVQPHYGLVMGSGVLDLTALQVPDGRTVTTNARVGTGQMQVLLPPGLDTQVTCETPIGTVNCLGQSPSSIPARVNVSDPGSDGPGGGKLVLDVRAGVGQVWVERSGATK